MNIFVKKTIKLNHPQKIILIGFMGSGKSTMGKRLAHRLGLPFIDLDTAILEEEGSDIPIIFETKGEDYFRKIEHQKLKEILSTESQFVLATGGGTPCFHNNMKLINENGFSIYIKYTAAFLSSRLIAAKTVRPLIKDYSNSELKVFVENLLLEREPFYLKSNCIIEKINLKVDDFLEVLKIK